MSTPGVGELGDVVAALREWPVDGAPLQLHAGDLGWHWRFGAEATAAAVRTWRGDGRILALGLLDGGTLRLAIAPDRQQDAALADQLAQDLTAERGVLFEEKASVEAPDGALIRELLIERGWGPDEPWMPLRRDLTEPVPDAGLRIEVVGPDRTAERTAVQRAAFPTSTFTDERWHAMAAGPLYADARCLVGYDDRGVAVAAVTVWSAGAGRPGLLEPMGVHRDHRGRGYGTSITLAAAAALRELGSSTATVCTPSANVGGVATYRAAGFRESPAVPDLARRM
jgi:GNAT superfamily N-acetyltransferase